MTKKFVVELDEDLATRLSKVNKSEVVEVLTELAEDQTSSGELSDYNSVSEIMEDDKLSEVRKQQLKIRAQSSRSNIWKR